MQPSALVLIGVITPTAGILGSLVWPVLQRRYAWTNLKVLIILVIMASMIPAYGCLGFLPLFRRVKFGGLTTQGEMFGLAVYFGERPPTVNCPVANHSSQVPFMAPSKATPEPSMLSCSPLERRRDGDSQHFSAPICTRYLSDHSHRYGLFSITDKVMSHTTHF